MFCTKCGTQNDDNAYKCIKCGEVMHRIQEAGQSVPNYLVQSILVTLLCCLPLGIPAIVYAGSVNGRLAAGDIAGAKQASDKAKMWCWVSLGFGIGALLITVLLGFLGALGDMLHQ